MGKRLQLRNLLNSWIVSAAVLTVCASLGHADQGSFANSGGSGSGGAGIVINSTVANPAGALSINCPGSVTSCSGGNFTYSSTDGSTAIAASFTSGTFAESCSGGGKGGHTTCGYSLAGYFSGTLTLNGATQAIVGIPASKEHIIIRIDRDVLRWFRSNGKGYQTLMNNVLRAFVQARQTAHQNTKSKL